MTSNKIDFCKYSGLSCNAAKSNANVIPVYGPFEKLFINDWGQCKIHNAIIQAFVKMDIKQMVPIQQNSFLYLMNNYNIAMVGFSKGKSISYLASIFSSIMENSSDNSPDLIIKPKAIVLSSSLESCFILEDLSKQLLSLSNNKVKVVVAYVSTSVKKTIATLNNGCDVLIATPSSLHNLLLKTNLFSWMDLKYFILDNIDLLLENYNDQMVKFLKIVNKIKIKNNVQMISASVKWSKAIEDFLNLLFVKWQYVFGSHLEAARYMQIGFNVVHAENDKLKKILYDFKNNIKCRRCVLITSNPDEPSIISSYFQQDDSNIEVLLPGQIKSAKVHTQRKWNEPLAKNKLILICSDDMMYDFYIDNADCLIHYDILINKKTFSTRFSVLQDSNNTFIKKERSTYIFLSNDSKDMLQLPKVVETMKIFGNGEVPPVLLKNSKMINTIIEEKKSQSILCNNIKQFGLCSKVIVCKNRHILLKEIDEPDNNIPKSGLAIVQILNVYDASHMSAKLLKLNSTNNLNDVQHWSNVDDPSNAINQGLSLLYSEHSARNLHQHPKPGDVVAVQLDSINIAKRNTEYFRAIVTDLLDENTLNPKVKVKLIDLGCVESVSKWRVFLLPDKWKSMPTTTVDIFLVSVKPIDFDKKWSSKANIYVQKQLKCVQDCGDTLIVKIEMALKNTILIKKLYRKFWNPELKTYDIEAILPHILLTNAYADMNFIHMEKLTELSVSAGIKIPSLLKNNKENFLTKINVDEFMSLYKLPKPQWAHLDDLNISMVSLEYMISPTRFFVVNSKFYDRVDNLLVKITEYVEQKKVDKLKHVIKGAICLAKFLETDQYYRAQVIEILNDELVEVLFVDKGHIYELKSNSLLTIHPNLIIQLPFQGIECSLSGIKDEFPLGEKLNEIIDYIFDLTEGLLHLQVINTTSSAQFTDGKHYEILLYDDINVINLEFRSKFSQYCDNVQMSKLVKLIKNKNKSYVLNENNFNNKLNMNPENILIEQLRMHNFGWQLFGQKYKDILKINQPRSEDSKEHNNSLAITDISDFQKPLTENKNVTNATTNELIGNTIPVNEIKETKCINSFDPLIEKKSSPKENLKLNMQNQNPCLTCNTSELSIIPSCIWYQDKNYIYLKLIILEIDKFNIESTAESIMFNGQFNDESYTFHAVLYGFIIKTNVTHTRNHDGIYIKAEKLFKTEYKWPRILTCEKWHTYLIYDTEKIKTENLTQLCFDLEVLKAKGTGTSLNESDLLNEKSNTNDHYSNRDDDVDKSISENNL